MDYEDIKQHLDRRPFRAITVHTADGDLIPLRSPEFAFLHPFKRLLYVAADRVELPVDKFINLQMITQISTDDGFDLARAGS